ncbi:hypothetical protein EV363DRAFT_1319550 [Boletus edulis]|nr:hypothetical protein EV363DRAFT_1319550 [Boletus edulis]
MQNEIDQMLEDARRLLGIDNVWEELGMYVPARLLSPIPEESLADELVVEEDAHSPPQSFKHAICFEERQWVAEKVRIMTKSSAEPPIPPRPPDVYLRQRRRRWKPPNPSLIRRPWKRDTFLATFDLGKVIMMDVPRASEHPFVACGRLGSNIALASTQSTSPWWNGIVAREAVM